MRIFKRHIDVSKPEKPVLAHWYVFLLHVKSRAIFYVYVINLICDFAAEKDAYR